MTVFIGGKRFDLLEDEAFYFMEACRFKGFIFKNRKIYLNNKEYGTYFWSYNEN